MFTRELMLLHDFVGKYLAAASTTAVTTTGTTTAAVAVEILCIYFERDIHMSLFCFALTASALDIFEICHNFFYTALTFHQFIDLQIISPMLSICFFFISFINSFIYSTSHDLSRSSNLQTKTWQHCAQTIQFCCSLFAGCGSCECIFMNLKLEIFPSLHFCTTVRHLTNGKLSFLTQTKTTFRFSVNTATLNFIASTLTHLVCVYYSFFSYPHRKNLWQTN